GEAVARALEKQPADRFQTAGELFAALSQGASVPGQFAGESAPFPTARSPVETVANTPVNLAADDLDEVTVVRPRDLPPAYDQPAAERNAMASFNPWRIMVPSLIVLVVVFGVVFLLTRGTSQTPTDQTQGQTGLSADPNSQSVQPAGSPTGESERSLQPVPSVSPSGGSVDANVNAGRGLQLPPSKVTGEFGTNGNENTSGRGNKNASQPRESPLPKPSPSVVIKVGPPPPPKTSPTITPSPNLATTPTAYEPPSVNP